METQRGTGCLPETPLPSDWTMKQGWQLLRKIGAPALQFTGPAWQRDLEMFLGPIEDQGRTNSCVAHAVAYAMECRWRLETGKAYHLSRLGLYYGARKLDRMEGADNGTFIRSCLGAARLFGTPVESYWPFSESQVNAQPGVYELLMGTNYRVTHYWRCNQENEWGIGQKTEVVCQNIRAVVACNVPVVLGAYISNLWTHARADGIVHLPNEANPILSMGHGVCLLGYDDTRDCGESGVGAFRFVNSWSASWGDKGFGWLPYKYVLEGLTFDPWAVLRLSEMINPRELWAGAASNEKGW